MDTSGCDLFGIGTRLTWPNPNAATQTFIMGTKIGDGIRMAGKNGGSIHQSGAIVFRGTLGLYGCFVDGTGNIQFLNGTSVSMEVAGSTLHTSGVNASFLLGNSDTQPLRMFNNTLSSASISTIVSSAAGLTGANNVLAATAPSIFFASASQNRSLSKLILSGAPTVSDIRMNTGATTWTLNDVVGSGTAGIPFVLAGDNATIGNGATDYRTCDTKLVDQNGNTLSGIPIIIESDYFGLILDDVTSTDGDVPFTFGANATDQVLPVREYYSTGPGFATAVKDSVFTMTVNGYGASTPPNQSYETQFITFTWPGRNRFGTGYQTDGGGFLPTMDVIMLKYGFPSTNQHTQWIERLVP